MSKHHSPIDEASCRRYGRRQLLGRIHSLGIDLAELPKLAQEAREMIRRSLGGPDTPAQKVCESGRFGYITDVDVHIYKEWDAGIAEYFGMETSRPLSGTSPR